MRFKNLKQFLAFRNECPLCFQKLNTSCLIDGTRDILPNVDNEILHINCNIHYGGYVEGIDIKINVEDNSVVFDKLSDDGITFELIVHCTCSKYQYTSNLLLFKDKKELSNISLFNETLLLDDLTVCSFYDSPHLTSVKIKNKYVTMPLLPFKKIVGLSENQIKDKLKRLLIMS